jgi:hypothetical protein
VWEALKKWPLLIVGIVMLGWGVKLVDQKDPSDARSLLIGLGCLLLGVGLGEVLRKDCGDKETENSKGINKENEDDD